MEYPIVIISLSEEDGGGYMGYAPDLHGCMSDGATQEEALANTKLAIADWIAEFQRLGREVPKPGSAARQMDEGRRKLIAALKAYSDLDHEIDRLSESIEELRQQVENNEQWARFAKLTGKIDPESQTELPKYC